MFGSRQWSLDKILFIYQNVPHTHGAHIGEKKKNVRVCFDDVDDALVVALNKLRFILNFARIKLDIG